MNPNLRLMPIIVGIVGIIFALFIGQQIGSSNIKLIEGIIGVSFVMFICLWMRTRIWLLIPFSWGLTGRISVLPLPFSVRDLSILLVAGMFCLFFALKLVRFKSTFGWLEGLTVLNVIYVVTMFMRHPVGTSAFGSMMVGGRPYFDVGIAFIAFLIFRLVILSPQQARIFPFFLLAGSLLVTALNLITRYIPALVPVVAPLYSGINTQEYLVGQGYKGDLGKEGGRFLELADPGNNLLQILCSYFKPLSLLLPANPFRMVLLFVSGAFLLLSGYRSYLISGAFFFFYASYYQGGLKDLVSAAMLAVVTLVAVIVLQLAVGLPLQAQRALSFIPFIPWNELQKQDADHSTEWRIDMWKMVWNEKKYINDKILGDGFGFSAYELSLALASESGGPSYGGSEQEAFMVNGAFHSGPLSSIRFAGIVGLIIYLILIFYMAAQAPRLIKLARGTPFFVTTIYFIMPMIYGPFFFIFIFGAYDSAIPDVLFQAGMFRMIKNSLESYLEAQKISKVTPPPEIILAAPVFAHRRFQPQKQKL